MTDKRSSWCPKCKSWSVAWSRCWGCGETLEDKEMPNMECRTCHGSGEIVVGWNTYAASRISPPDPIDGECPVCLGHGEVALRELEEFGGGFPGPEEAAEIFHDRQRMLEDMAWERKVDLVMEGER